MLKEHLRLYFFAPVFCIALLHELGSSKIDKIRVDITSIEEIVTIRAINILNFIFILKLILNVYNNSYLRVILLRIPG